MGVGGSNTGGKGVNHLASQLSTKERTALLERLKLQQSPAAIEPLYSKADSGEDNEPLEEQYRHLPWLARFFYRLNSIFGRVPVTKAFEEGQLTKLGKQIQAASPGILDYKELLLLSDFYTRVSELKDATRFFYAALNAGFRDKNLFYAFLSSLVMAEIDAQLQKISTPEEFAKDNPNLTMAELKTFALREAEEAINNISERQSKAMTRNVSSLFYLKELSSFSFDRLLMSFSINKQGKKSCHILKIREMLVALNNSLFSLNEPPPLSDLESLFVFQMQDKKDESGFDMEQEVKNFLAKAEESIAVIRNFNKTIPLTKIISFAFHKLDYAPKQLKGEDDWLTAYREYWRRLTDTEHTAYIQEKKRGEVVTMFKTVLGGASIESMENAFSQDNRRGFPLNEDLTLAFLKTFHSSAGFEKNDVLQAVMFNGEFYAKDTQTRFNDAYNSLTKITQNVDELDAKISRAGVFGNRYAQLQSDTSPATRKKVQFLQDEAAKEAKDIITRNTAALLVMTEVFDNALKKDKADKFGTIKNLEKLAISSKNKEAFVKGMGELSRHLHEVLEVLKELDDMRKAKNK